MLAEKTVHSIFVPDLVLVALLPDKFPAWKRCVQSESLQWLMKAALTSFCASKCAGCIVNAENQLLHEREMADSKHLTHWACGLIRARVANTSLHEALFVEISAPVLLIVAFRGAEETMKTFMKELRNEFETVLKTIHLNPMWFKYEAVRTINAFETRKLGRVARSVSARVLGRHPILFGGMVYASAFALAFVRLLWMDRKTLILIKLGVVPMFPCALRR